MRACSKSWIILTNIQNHYFSVLDSVVNFAPAWQTVELLQFLLSSDLTGFNSQLHSAWLLGFSPWRTETSFSFDLSIFFPHTTLTTNFPGASLPFYICFLPFKYSFLWHAKPKAMYTHWILELHYLVCSITHR